MNTSEETPHAPESTYIVRAGDCHDRVRVLEVSAESPKAAIDAFFYSYRDKATIVTISAEPSEPPDTLATLTAQRDAALAALKALADAVATEANEANSISGYMGARLSDARDALAAALNAPPSAKTKPA